MTPGGKDYKYVCNEVIGWLKTMTWSAEADNINLGTELTTGSI